jgi:glycerol kinase
LLFGNIDAYLMWHLSGEKLHITDVTNASRTQLMNLQTCEWDDELLRLFNIPRAMLPHICPSSEHYTDLAISTLAGVPICSLLGDQQAALVGQNCLEPGDSKNTYGTGCFLLMNTGTAAVVSKAGLLTTVAYKLGNAAPVYALEGSIAVAGALVQWIRDNLGLIEFSDEIEALANTVDNNGGVYFVPAFSGLYAPYWKDSARGIIAGLTRFANKGHLARAILEATALQTVDVARAMESDSGFALSALRTDGGMVGNNLLMQIQADLLNCAVLRPRTRETTALGAAYAAGLACGFYESPEDLSANWVLDRRWEPNMAEPERRHHLHQWSKAIARSFDWEEAAGVE